MDAPASNVCPNCHLPRSARGCVAGRCFGPASALDTPALAEKPPPRSVVRAPLGPKRVVLAAEVRVGPGGGFSWRLEIECRCIIVRLAGKRPRAAPRFATCLSPGCAGPTLLPCTSGCGEIADERARATSWVFTRGFWFCRACARRVLGA